MIFFMPPLVSNIIVQELYLENGTSGFPNWVDPPVDMYLSFRVFDFQNPLEFIKSNAKPIFVERGPFTYLEHKPRTNLTAFPENSSISFLQPTTYVRFVPERSAEYPDNTTITTINIPLVLLASKLGDHLSSPQKILIKLFFEYFQEQLFIRKTVSELLWGYDDPILSEAEKVRDFLKKFNITIPLSFPDKIGLFYGKNNTDDGWYNVYTGRSDPKLINKINTWKFNKSLSWWPTPYANDLNGTDGTLFYPGVSTADILNLFPSDLCRSFSLEFLQMEVLYGIKLYRFWVPDREMADPLGNSSDSIANRDFCTPSGTIKDCKLPGGVLNISVCQNGMPLLMSNPHFYQGSSFYPDHMIGIHPDREKHMTYLDIEPNTGSVLNAAKRIQINVFASRLEALPDSYNFGSGTAFPVAWFEESAQINETIAAMARSQGLDLLSFLTITLPVVLLLTGGVLVFLSLVLIVVCRQRLGLHANAGHEATGESETDPLISRSRHGPAPYTINDPNTGAGAGATLFSPSHSNGASRAGNQTQPPADTAQALA